MDFIVFFFFKMPIVHAYNMTILWYTETSCDVVVLYESIYIVYFCYKYVICTDIHYSYLIWE